MQTISYFSCHFHYVDSLTWLCIRSMMQRLVVARLEQGRATLCFNMSEDDCDYVLDFLEQMDIAYLHPRRDSLHVSLLASQYSNVQIKAGTIRKAIPSASPLMKKNPKSNRIKV